MSDDRFDETVSAIYEAALLPTLWPTVLSRLCEDLGFMGGLVTMRSEGAESWIYTPSMKGISMEFAAGGWPARNERMTRILQLNSCSFVQDFDLFTPEEWETSPLYREFLFPRGHGYGAGTLISTPGRTQIIVALERLLREGPVSAETIQRLDRLRPHMARALVLQEASQRQQAQTMLDSLSLAGLAAAIVTGSGRIVAANAEFETLDAQLPITARDQLLPTDAPVRLQLQTALADISPETVRSIAVPGTESADAFVLHVLPLRRNARDLAPLGAAILLASRVMRVGETTDSTRLLRTLYDLTRSEAKVALAILGGSSLREIAARDGLSYETVRSFAKSAYGKTGSDGQVELVRRLSILTAR